MAFLRQTNTIPPHLRKYVVTQDYSRYTPEDQAVWRYLMRQLKNFLSQHAHELYSEGLDKTGISIDRIPNIYEMNRKLQKFGWGAIPVSGFIPPAAFMEFQARGFLPIACDMRSIEHILYTPAPDIVHEAAGHAPIIIDEEYADYLRAYAEVAAHSIISAEDIEQYRLIRELSDLKERNDASESEVKKLEKQLEDVSNSMSHVSEAGMLSRMNWWTAEYGLIGSKDQPKLFGAGLLSSLGEARDCLKPQVKKISFDINCLDYSYDITEPQPQLFVTPHFKKLTEVLEQLAQTMAFRTGGTNGLDRAIEAKSVNTIELDSGLQISGKITSYKTIPNSKKVSFIRLEGPTQLSYERVELLGHDKAFHSHGYSSPIGKLKNIDAYLSSLSPKELRALGIERNKRVQLDFASGISVEGLITEFLIVDDQLILVSFSDCTVTDGDEVLFQPDWGQFDMAVGNKIVSVFGGPADRIAYGETDDFVAARVPQREYSDEQLRLHRFYQKIRTMRETQSASAKEVEDIALNFISEYANQWLVGIECLELCHQYKASQDVKQKVVDQLKSIKQPKTVMDCIRDGIAIADKLI